MSVAKISGPQLLDVPLRPSEEPVHVQTVGVGCHLRRHPDRQPHERLRQCFAQPEDALEGGQAYLHGRPGLPRASSRRSPPPNPLPQAVPAPGARPRRWPPSARRKGARDWSSRGCEASPRRGRTIPHLTQCAPSKPADCFTWRGCSTASSVESTTRVSGSPTNSGTTARLRSSRKRLSLRSLRWKEEGARPTTPGNRCEKNLSVSRKKERWLSTPRSCWKSASARTSESESR